MDSINLAAILTSSDPAPDYLVENLLCAGQMVIVAGEAGVGKSFCQYSMALAIATGSPFLGRTTRQGKVLYFDEENSAPDLGQYLRWVWRGAGCPPIDVFADNLNIQHFSLAPHGAKRWAYMAKLAAKLQPALIVVDTATPVCDIADENDNAEASRAVQRLRAVKEAGGPQTSMIVLKHVLFNHDPMAKRTIRGAKIWLDRMDAVIYHTNIPGRPRADGLRNTQLSPDKVRAFGLRSPINIVPAWVGEAANRGISLSIESKV